MSAPLTIAVVSWNTRDLLRTCLRSVLPEIAAGRAEVTVVDNASSDGSADLVRAEFPQVRLIAHAENVGFGRAVNEAAAGSTSEWIAPANADIALTPGALERLLAAGAEHPDAGILAPRLLGPEGATQHSVYPFPTLPFTLAFNLGIANLRGDQLTLEGHWDPERPRYVDWAIGAFVLVRRTTWEAIDGFDTAQWMYAEDLDLGWRAAGAGWRTWYEPGAIVAHAGAAATTQAFGDARRERWLRSTYAWMRRRRGSARTSAYGAMNVAGALGRAALHTPAAALGSAESRHRRWEMMQWARNHARALRASRNGLDGPNR